MSETATVAPELKELGDKISEENKKKIEEAKAKLEEALKNNQAGIRPAMDELNKIWSDASSEMYQSAQAQGAPGGNGQQEPEDEAQEQEKKDDNVEEADYKIVDDEKDDK